VITGFNTDVEHDGVIYHVQTEDKGLETPLILSLVYAGGAILASKRSPYEDLIASGFDEAVLSERLKRQHRLICAAIRAGRVEELKRMSQHVTGRLVAPPASQEIVDRVGETAPDDTSPEETFQPVPDEEPYGVEDFPSDSAPSQELPEFDEGLRVSLLEEREFRSGEKLSLAVLVSHKSTREDKPLSGIPVSVKILGTTFRPLIVSVKTQKDGIAHISTEIPKFTSGRAAILVRAVRGGDSVEIRRVVHPAS
jgi:hypothetical protein